MERGTKDAIIMTQKKSMSSLGQVTSVTHPLIAPTRHDLQIISRWTTIMTAPRSCCISVLPSLGYFERQYGG